MTRGAGKGWRAIRIILAIGFLCMSGLYLVAYVESRDCSEMIRFLLFAGWAYMGFTSAYSLWEEIRPSRRERP
jgi:FtsH-binding integral membrane protein